VPISSTTSGSILAAWKARIDVLAPITRAGVDDKYQAIIGLRHTYMGSRAILLTCNPGRRLQGGRTCSDWEMTALIETWYLDNPGAYSQACEDAEQIADDLYTWISSTDGEDLGLLRIEPELATIAGGEGELQLTRTVRFVYRGLS
jgi:hypothetical protein